MRRRGVGLSAALRASFQAASAGLAAGWGVPGFVRPRVPPVVGEADPTEVSLSDTSPLHDTLLRLVDFDRQNTGPVRLSIGAVEVETGNLAYFDNRATRIGTEHIMASGALPPEWRDDPDLRRIMAAAAEAGVTVAHLIYRPAGREGGARDCEFSRLSIAERWRPACGTCGTRTPMPPGPAAEPRRPTARCGRWL